MRTSTATTCTSSPSTWDESGRRLNQDFLFRRSERIRKDLERKYGLHSAERRGERIERPLCKVDVAAGDIKKQVGNIVKAVNRQYRFQSLGEYRALLSLYNVTVEEARGHRAWTGIPRAGVLRNG